MNRRRWGLSTELILWHSFALVMVCLGIGIISHYFVLRPIRERLPQEARVFAAAIAEQVLEPLWYLDTDRIADLLERQKVYPAVLGMRVENQFGDVLAAWQQEENVSSGISVKRPVYYRGERIGMVYVTWSMQPLHILQSGLWPALFAITIFGIVAQLLLTLWLIHRFLRTPLHSVVDSLRKVADGHFDLQIPMARHQELRMLLHEARRMASRIRERTVSLHNEIAERQRIAAELITHKEELELQVRQRTQALGQANEALRREIEQRKQAQQAIIEVSTHEQQGIGQDLHDTLVQEIVGARYLFAAIEKSFVKAVPACADQTRQMSATLQEILEHVRMLAHGMMVVDLREGGLPEALRQYAERTSGLFPISCVLKHADQGFPEVNATVSVQLYYIAREAVNNAIRHGKAMHIRITLGKEGGCPVMKVTDNGKGFVRRNDSNGMGLRIMQNRAESIDAAFSLWSKPHLGTCIRCVLTHLSS